MNKKRIGNSSTPSTLKDTTDRRKVKNAKSLGVACLVVGIAYVVLLGMIALAIFGIDQLAHSNPGTTSSANDVPTSGFYALLLAIVVLSAYFILDSVIVGETILFIVTLIYNLSNYKKHKFSPAKPLIFASIGLVLTVVGFFIFGSGRSFIN